MLMSGALSRVSRSVGARSLLLSASKSLQTPSSSTQFHSLICEYPNKVITSDVFKLQYSTLNFSAFRRFGVSSSASPEPSGKEHGSTVENNGDDPAKASGNTNPGEAEVTKESGFNSESQNTVSQSEKGRRRATKRTAFSDSDSESNGDASMADMVKLVEEKEELLNAKQKEIEQMKDKVVRTLAEMENVIVRTRREAENSKKFAIQNFAKGLLDVADNLARASTHVKGSFSKIDESKDTAGAVPLLKTLLEGVEMTEKQLEEVFRKFGVEKFDPTNEPFDPHRHNAVFQVPDNSKPPGTVAHVLKAGYMLYDRVIRPAEVGVTQATDNDATENSTSDKGPDA
ncbi:grpE protein-like protein [Hibiscus syriacus]|uniref:GrpE protein homolog n=1 Tax=Hibiscus syriacus TaxID=106335 RepID=A0A6A3CHW0_HIBSY|nr:grpE protein homolog 2, mitochondrial-like isoform X1 [Hibiscus syriacus]KAE8726888.1 grpE protein-like protein [Hibiscus syriacus]